MISDRAEFKLRKLAIWSWTSVAIVGTVVLVVKLVS